MPGSHGRAGRLAAAVAAAVVLGALVAVPAAAHADPAPAGGSVVSSDGVLASALERLAASGTSPGSAEGALAAGLPAEGSGSLVVDDADRVVVDIRFTGRAEQEAAVDAVSALAEVRSVTESAPTIVAYATPESFAALAALPGVAAVNPALTPAVTGAATLTTPDDVTGAAEAGAAAGSTAGPAPAAASCRSIPVNSAAPLKADLARAEFGVDGTGVRVGIISNSFDLSGPSEPDVLVGSLPGPGNPCGYTTPVTVLEQENPKLLKATDEGRAMAQVVHGIAPGATLSFSTMGVTDAEFADSILKLQRDGADVIVDDAVQYDEPWYQQGLIAQTIRKVTEQGVLYIAAAQNENSIGTIGTDPAYRSVGSWEAEAYRPTECIPAVAEYAKTHFAHDTFDCNDFAPDGAKADPLLIAQFDVGDPVNPINIVAQWTEPVDGLQTTIVPFVVFKASADAAPVVLGTSSTLGADVPASLAQVITPPGSNGTYGVVLARVTNHGTPQQPGVKMIFALDDAGVANIEYSGEWPAGVTIGPSVFAHPADPSTFTIGAAPAFVPTEMEPYSGTGPARYLFGPVETERHKAAERLAEPTVLVKPDVVGVDQVQNTFFGTYVPSGPLEGYYFSGTSAAAPNIAGVAALALQHSPEATVGELRAAFESTAVPLPAQRWSYGVSDENVWGSGLVDAAAALAALPAAPAPVPAAVPDSPRLAATGEASEPLGAVALAAVAALAAGGALLLVRTRGRTRLRGAGRRPE
ncbi:S8 family serine peptidase [Herbiconiux sp. YIM B11900]|uniref:S8 family serine peptidase n=1 Tax=Herbiconiux sp. YIM B11900 TaxID=3404131 RepID=UPI003F82B1BD